MRFLLLLPALITTASAADPVITYDEHIKPIFREHCLKCHGEDEQKADLNLANFTAVLKGGSGDKAVIAGRASQSLLFQAITAEDDAERMPPKKAAIPSPQIELIRQWIQGGLRESSASKSLVALGGSGKVIKIYGTADGKLRHKLTKHTDWITALAFSPDGKKLASSDRAGGIHLWDATGGGILLSLSEHKAAVRALAWRSDSKMLASGGEDGLLIWWDAKDGWPTVTNNNAHPPARPQGTYGKIPNGVLSLAFGPNGELLSAGRDKQVRLWNASGVAVKSFASEAALPLQTSIAFDGKGLYAGDASGAVHYWAAGK